MAAPEERELTAEQTEKLLQFQVPCRGGARAGRRERRRRRAGTERAGPGPPRQRWGPAGLRRAGGYGAHRERGQASPGAGPGVSGRA